MEFDWFTLLLIFIFFVLPMLQQVFQKKKPPEELPPEEEAEWEWEQAQRGEPDRVARRSEPGEWAEEWGEWPGDREEAAEAARERSAWEELGLGDLFPEPQRQPEPQPAPQPAPQPREPQPRAPEPVILAPVPTQPRPAPPVPVPAPRPSATAPAPPSRTVSLEAQKLERDAQYARFHERALRSPVATVRRDPRTLVAAQVHDPDALRRALILNEVLGPPRALRPLEQDRPR